jgi:hypothetical protein
MPRALLNDRIKFLALRQMMIQIENNQKIMLNPQFAH